jgi:hypothetical protein
MLTFVISIDVVAKNIWNPENHLTKSVTVREGITQLNISKLKSKETQYGG